MTRSPDPARLAAPAAGRQQALSGNAVCVGSMMLWAAGFPAAEMLLRTWSTLALISARLLVAVLFLVAVWAVLDGPRVLARARWGRGLMVGSLGFGLGTWLLLVGQKLTDPVTVAIIASSSPIAAALIEVWRDGRRLTTHFAVGVAAAVAGGVVATGGGVPAEFGLGALAAVASCFLFAWGSHAAARDFPELSVTGRATVTLAGGLVFAGALYLGAVQLGFDSAPAAPVDAGQLGLLGIYAVCAMGLSQLLWIASVGRLGIGLASFHINVAPFYVMVIMLVLGAAWSWPQAIGAAIVGAGVVLAQRG
ncbi:DMT family transporter [Roseovarius salinarum]|uniref:DMT family transporter n=1 Tax=Roseovarius salinarum TaxID=1981892 RepID=UPI000C3486A8|nr:DMT family transporter [Roseovarius salinarum]